MSDYDYRESMKDDIRQYIDDEIDLTDYDSKEDAEQELYDRMFISDSITGNASGSYYCNAYAAEESICHNLDLLGKAIDEFGGDAADLLSKGAEAADVTIRCYLLGECLSEVLDEYDESGTWDNED